MTRVFEINPRGRRKAEFRLSRLMYAATVIVCVSLIFLTGFIAVTHFHPNDLSSPDHSCSLCALAHAGIAINNAAAPAPVFAVSMLAESPVISQHFLLLVFSEYIRPPPQA